MVRNLQKLLFLATITILLSLGFTDKASAQISGIYPATITAGTQSILTISGKGFGAGGPSATQYVQFTGASGLLVQPLVSAYTSWSDAQIVVKVPTDAGTGVIKIVNGNTVITSTLLLTVSFDLLTTPVNGIAYTNYLVNSNNLGGYTFQMSTGFNANTNANNLFTLALKTWKCATAVNWTIGAVTTVNVAANDGVNVVRFANVGDNLADGLLGQATTFFQSKDGVRWEAKDIDITFANSAVVTWNFTTGAPTSSQYDFTTAALHELGHAHSLGHVNDATDIMYSGNTTGIAIRTLSANDLNAGNLVMQSSTASASSSSYVYPPMIASTSGGCTVPSITSFAPTNGNSGTTVTITGTNFTGATAVYFGNTAATSFTVNSATSITAVVGAGASGNVSVATSSGTTVLGGFTYVFSLPPNNFQLAITSATCKGSKTGTITITAQQVLSYSATITYNGVSLPFTFNSTQPIGGLAAGTYAICIGVVGQPNFQQCFTAVISEPKDISLYTTVNPTLNNVTLALTGGNRYDIVLNGTIYTTTASSITLPLNQGVNNLAVTTDKPCQGLLSKTIDLSSNTIPYPEPFQNILNLNLGLNNVSIVVVEVHAVSDGRLVYNKQYTNQSGVIQLDLSGLANGIYSLKLTTGNTDKIYKILKK
jgi:hypothetical protein